VEITFAEMYSGIGGIRHGLEKASNLSNSNSHAKGETDKEEEYSIGKRYNTLERNGTSREERTTNSRTIDKCAERQSYRCVWANDNNKYACQIYRKHYGEKELVEGDIRTIDPDTIPDFDLLTAGFPCQSFSLAGKRRGFEDTRGTLFYEIARVASVKRPRLLLLENVKGLLSNNEGRTFTKILQTLDELGYDVEWQVLNSKHFGVPQNRERVFIVGHLRTEPTRQIFPIGESSSVSSSNEKGRQGVASCLDANYHKGARRQRTFVLQEHSFSGAKGRGRGIRKYEDEVPALTQQMGTGGNNVPMIMPCLTPDRLEKRQHGRRFKPDGEPSFTLTGQDIHGIMIANTLDRDGYLRTGARPRDENGKPQLLPIGYRRIRRLTPVECERLQGFPDGWTEGVSDTQRYKLLGNAVTTNVIEFLGQHLSSLFCV